MKKKQDQDIEQTELFGKTIMLVNTGSVKKKFILQRLKQLGLRIIIVHHEKNWAAPYVDRWILTDTKNHNKTLEDIESFLSVHSDLTLDGILTFWEDDVLLTAKVADALGLINVPAPIVRQVRDKSQFRKFCTENDIRTPEHLLIKDESDLDHVATDFTFPVVLKPSFGSGSAFVIKAQDKEELYSTYEYIERNISPSVESSLNEGLDVLVESYIDGDEVDIDMLLQNGKIKYFAIVDNYRTEEPFFIETQQAIPSELPQKDQDALVEMAETVLEKLGIQNGCIHFEAKATRRGPVPIEINLRMGGDETYAFSKEAWGVDLIEGAVKIALGIYLPKVRKPDTPRKYLMSNTFTPKQSGLLVKLDVSEQIKKVPGVEELCLFRQAGDAVLVPPEGYEYLGWIVVSGENPLDTEHNFNEALKCIRYDVARFHASSSIGKTLRRNRFSMASANKDLLEGAAKIERMRRTSIKNQRNLHVGVVYNMFQEEDGVVEASLSAMGADIEEALQERGYLTTAFDMNEPVRCINELRNSNVDIVFNACGRINNSSMLKPHSAAILDMLRIPYTGSNPFTLGLCNDKIRIKKLLSFHNIPTPRWDYAYTTDDEIDQTLKYPLIVKPANTDNSIGITNESVVTDRTLLQQRIAYVIHELGSPALIEEYIEGDEYAVPIIGSEEDDLRVLPLSRLMFDTLPEGFWHIVPYEAKWGDRSAYEKIATEEPSKNSNKKLESLITEIALDTYNILDCHDYGIVEVKVDKNNNPYVLELNPNQHMGTNDILPRAARLVKMSYADLVEEVIRVAIKRYENRPHYYHLQTDSM